jgi:UDP:flavonoid glycosyltransferase YjiC (YdhE family)
MAHIVLTCWGSHGDIDPFLGLGLGLRDRGHRVTLATIEYYRQLVESAGLVFKPVRPKLEPIDKAIVERIMDPARGSEFLLTEVICPQIQGMYEDVSAAAEAADVLVSHPVTYATPIVAEQRKLPWASVVLAPASMFSAYDFPVIPPAPWLKSMERLGSWTGKLLLKAVRRSTAAWAAPVYALRARLGLPRGANPILEGQHSPSLVIALYSQLLGDRQPDWPAHVAITGHAFYDAPHGTALAPELTAFLDAGNPPVVFTLGSSVVFIARDFWQESVEAVRQLGVRAVLVAGDSHAALRSQLEGSGTGHDQNIAVVERAPHSLLFPRASAVVQQCGVGTLAQSLRSGRPMLGVPHAHDQPDNAWRAARLGMALTLNPKTYRAARVAAALRTLIRQPAYAAAAGQVARQVRAERGVVAACEALERTFSLSRS